MKALITAGGRGTRLRPITDSYNKHLISIGNKPMIYYALETIASTGIKDVGVIYDKSDISIQEEVGSGKKFGIKITYIVQKAPLGLAHVLKVSESFIDKSRFVFFLGDNLIIGGIQSFLDEFKNSDSNCHLILSKTSNLKQFGVPEINGNKIVSIEEKPMNPKSPYAVSGVYFYDETIFEAVKNIEPSERGELEISDAHQYLLDAKKKVTYSIVKKWWKDTGTPNDLLEANRLVLELQPSNVHSATTIGKDSKLRGSMTIGKGTTIKNSTIEGPVAIGDGCVIENSYIGKFSSIGHNTKILNSWIENSIILKGCNIRNLKGCLKETLLGNDVKILSSAGETKTHSFVLGSKSTIKVS